jgi:predicted transcriptional regulator
VFARNQLTSVTIPNSITAIGDSAFSDNQLTSVTISAGVDIKVSSFNGLLYAHYTANGRKAAVYAFARSKDGDFDSMVCNNIVEIAGYRGKAVELAIPEKINGRPVVAIGAGAFAENKLTDVTIPNSVTAIGARAFSENQLTHLTIPNGVTAIGDWAFSGNRLTSVTIPNSVTVIGDSAFEVNQLTHLTIPNSVTAIGDSAFWSNQLTSVTIPDSVTAIGDLAFVRNQLTRVTIPANVDVSVSSFNSLLYALYTANGRKAAVYAFSRSKDGDFDSMVCNNTVEIADYRGNATELAIPEKINGLPVVAIGAWAFVQKQLISVIIPNGVTAIGAWAFAENQLTGVTIPANVAIAKDSLTETFAHVYTQGGRRAGTYASGDDVKTWTRQ